MRKTANMRRTGRWFTKREPKPKRLPLIVFQFTDANGNELVTFESRTIHHLDDGDTYTFTIDMCSFVIGDDGTDSYVKVPIQVTT